MKTLKVRWTGIRPILMSNPQVVSVICPYSVEARRVNTLLKAARKKQDEDRLVELERAARINDFKSSAYWSGGDFHLPDTMILAATKEAARSLKKGKDIDRGVIMSETESVLQTVAKFKTMDAAFEDERFRFESPCKVPPRTGALVWKCRCMIPTGWVARFTLEYDDNMIAEKTLIEVNEIAGALVGVGSWRPRFGRFISEVEK